MDSDFMNDIAGELAAFDFQVVRFEFPYMSQRRNGGTRRSPDRMPVLRSSFLQAIDAVGGPEDLIIGGKSMGGRVASMITDSLSVRGLLCLGYPFHPPGRPGTLRVEHLKSLKTSTLILQGERDPFGGAEEVQGYDLSAHISVEYLPDGDHSFKPRAKSGILLEANIQLAASIVAGFLVEEWHGFLRYKCWPAWARRNSFKS